MSISYNWVHNILDLRAPIHCVKYFIHRPGNLSKNKPQKNPQTEHLWPPLKRNLKVPAQFELG